MPLEEARRNDEVISLADSQVLRWIDKLNGIADADVKAKEIKYKIKQIRKQPNSAQNKREIRKLYNELDKIQYKPDYMCLIIDREKDYYRACKGFSINGVRYVRLLGTNGGIKNSTIVFVSERLSKELRRRIDNGRDPGKELVPAKLEAYKALACSASIPVSFPRGIVVVEDCYTTFKDDYIYLTDEFDGEPVMTFKSNQPIEIDATDGFGMMLPSLAERWSQEMDLDYIVSGVNTRFSFEKGMVFTFDFIEFAEKVAGGQYMVKDAWGSEVDIRNVELVLTTSMVKLWDSYKSCEDYIQNSLSNGYTFGIAKVSPKEVDRVRNLNYQFIQSYDLTDEDIDELIKPTMQEIRDVLGGDWRKSVLFLKGSGLSENNISRAEDDIAKAIMIDERMVDDPYAQNIIYQAIRNRINEAKIGCIKVHGNFTIASGDPYSLCQCIFRQKVTGLLKAGEVYNRYWADEGSDKLACYRAPMTCHNNIRLVHVRNDDEVNHWYQYIKTCTIFNSWDMSCAALNGMDYDGDLVFLTDNNVLVNRLKPQPALMCAQRKAAKVVPKEEDFVKSNIESFGNDIGQTTNWITSMFEVQSHFGKDSKEYKALTYRIQCGQLYQQNTIDKAKGIICKPMPRNWHDRHAANKMESEEDKKFYRSIIADKKPYFMRYIYPDLMKEYNAYIRNTKQNALREFDLTVQELKDIPPDKLTKRQSEFLYYYDICMPVGTGDCVMNRICRKFEDAFDGHIAKHNASTKFDYTIMKSDAEYSQPQFYAIKRLYDEYNKRVRDYAAFSNYERVDEYEYADELQVIADEFRQQCEIICPDKEAMCNLLLDLCYTRSSTKKFAWSMCSHEIIANLLHSHDNKINFPVLDVNGDTEYGGDRYSVVTIEMEVNDSGD